MEEVAASSLTVSPDPEFLEGLASILAPFYTRGASEEEIKDVTKRAEEFWLSSKAAVPPSSNPPSISPASSSEPAQSSGQPPYPLSFAAVAALIASGEPVPGIKDIPDILAEGEPSVSTVDVTKIKKPWERVEEGDSEQV